MLFIDLEDSGSKAIANLKRLLMLSTDYPHYFESEKDIDIIHQLVFNNRYDCLDSQIDRKAKRIRYTVAISSYWRHYKRSEFSIELHYTDLYTLLNRCIRQDAKSIDLYQRLHTSFLHVLYEASDITVHYTYIKPA